jgi:hypothetical protein
LPINFIEMTPAGWISRKLLCFFSHNQSLVFP